MFLRNASFFSSHEWTPEICSYSKRRKGKHKYLLGNGAIDSFGSVQEDLALIILCNWNLMTQTSLKLKVGAIMTAAQPLCYDGIVQWWVVKQAMAAVKCATQRTPRMQPRNIAKSKLNIEAVPHHQQGNFHELHTRWKRWWKPGATDREAQCFKTHDWPKKYKKTSIYSGT